MPLWDCTKVHWRPCFRRLLDTTPATPKKTKSTLQSLCRLLLLHLGKQVDLLVDSYLCGRLDFKIQHFKSTTLPGIFRFFDAFFPDWSQNVRFWRFFPRLKSKYWTLFRKYCASKILTILSTISKLLNIFNIIFSARSLYYSMASPIDNVFWN